MKVLFTHSYFLQLDPKQVAHAQPYAPLGTILAAGFLRANGYDVQLFDPMFAKGPGELLPVLEKYKPDVLVVYDDGFNYLTKMC
ncbi:MAG TPA: radical SAM protein, partial [Chitinophagaceae bacterium]|nr:radical SAM protein [Chitinophagaceae bacterium]